MEFYHITRVEVESEFEAAIGHIGPFLQADVKLKLPDLLSFEEALRQIPGLMSDKIEISRKVNII
jgi:hypothetical protein